MVYQSRIKNAPRRTTLVLVFLCICGTNILAAADNSKAMTTGNAASSEAKPGEQTAQQRLRDGIILNNNGFHLVPASQIHGCTYRFKVACNATSFRTNRLNS